MNTFGQKSFRVLIVDDTPDIHEDIRKVLAWNAPEITSLQRLESTLFAAQDNGPGSVTALPALRIDSAFQGQQAFEMVEKALAEKQPYQLLFMDVRMPPGIDGIETTKKIWQIQPDVHVLICTAYSDYSVEGIIAKVGISDKLLFLNKPFSAAVLKQSTITLLKKWEVDRQLQENIQNLQTMVKEQSSRLVQSSKIAALGQMSAGVAHEINTPLCVIQLTAQHLDSLPDEEIVPSTVRSVLTKIDRMADRITKIISALTTISRTSEGDPFVPVALFQIVEDARILCGERFARYGIALHIGPVPDLQLECRRREISQVLLTVLSNAFDEVVRLPEKWVRVQFEAENGSLQIRITDSGKGIAPHVAERMFDPFFTTKEIGKGSGLGLSVSKGFMDNHGGSLTMDSQSPHTSFVIRLPLSHTARK